MIGCLHRRLQCFKREKGTVDPSPKLNCFNGTSLKIRRFSPRALRDALFLFHVSTLFCSTTSQRRNRLRQFSGQSNCKYQQFLVWVLKSALGHLHKTGRQSYVAVISGVKILSLTELVCRYGSTRLKLRFMQQEAPGDQRFCPLKLMANWQICVNTRYIPHQFNYTEDGNVTGGS